ncbi:uncharacterized protein ARMOST_16823 [Armillaria ostoyae]|uniref:Heterokaryon incompatibility domain-containing protein n=1 Tax=Armillaria ostoyae TaxID=47428 RepID=A0A284RX95_ARMOS|nr:uncharacterized protein ARMOST_16823 [Armillaria ostoyae]
MGFELWIGVPQGKHLFASYSLHLLSQEIVVCQSLCGGVMNESDDYEVNESGDDEENGLDDDEENESDDFSETDESDDDEENGSDDDEENDSNDDEENNSDDDEQAVEYPEVTISALTETGQGESSIIVPLQRAYSGRKPVITSSLADTPCATLGIHGLLDQFNTTLGTSYSLVDPFLSSLLEDCITNNYDFGIAYGRLRGIWYTDDWSTIQDELCGREEEDRETRRKALVGNRIVSAWLRPRRVWDLYSNRVVPYWITNTDYEHRLPRPISHAWMDEKDRAVMWTPINGYEWPVPIPKDANLNLIRIEMLNLGAEYAWLDVLCLRQVGGRREDIRTEEWKLDVPTIGAVYQKVGSKVVCYLSGLGRPLTLKEGDLESDRSWFRRAWTLQEIREEEYRVIAGDTPDGPLHAKRKDGKYETELLTRFHKQLQSTREASFLVFRALEEMRKRVSTNPVDKIAGLAFLMESATIPAYYESASLEEAWTALVNSLGAYCRAVLFFLCPEPGDRGPKWRPSWDQVMNKLLLEYIPDPDGVVQFIDRDETGDEDQCDAECIVEGLVRGLAVVEGGDRHGEFIVECDDEIARFKITAAHTYPIPEDTYTLIYGCDRCKNSYVVGRSLPGGKFEKVSVLEISDDDLYYITEKRRYILI